MATPPLTPAQSAQQEAAALQSYYTSDNNFKVAAYNQSVSNGGHPTPPMLTYVDVGLLTALYSEGVGPASIDPRWPNILVQVPYVPPITTPPVPIPETYTIGLALGGGMFEITDNLNAQIPPNLRLTATDGHTYQTVAVGFMGAVLAQLVA